MRDVAKMALLDAHNLPGEIDAGLEATVRFRPTQFPTWSNATHICVVEVDADSWIPEVKRYVVSEDCGRMINPNIVEGQVHGGVAQGIGGLLYEHNVYDDDGNPLASTFMDYLLPTVHEIPTIDTFHIESPAATVGGYKGVGEGGAIAAPAAVFNAIADALAPLGVELTRQPLTPDAIIEAIHAATPV
jgi:carbon-monoxide dehydrogenase large subunit